MRLTTPELELLPISLDADDKFAMEFHSHDECEINLVVRGRGRYEFPDGNSITADAGQILFLPPGNTHRLIVKRGFSYRGMVFMATRGGGSALRDAPPPAARLAPFVANEPAHYELLMQCYRQAQLELTASDAYRSEAVDMLRRLCTICVYRLIAGTSATASETAQSRNLARVRTWIEQNLSEPITLGQMARMAHLSPTHFSLHFRTAYGESPKAYLINRRIERAALLLQCGRLGIYEVALSVGFQHLAHFNRMFKARMGMPPTAWRKRHGIQEE